jgi:hypothetical protein
MFNILTYCLPALLIFGIGVLKALWSIYKEEHIYMVLLRFAFTLLWCYALNWLCTKGYASVSWACVVIPFAIRFAPF